MATVQTVQFNVTLQTTETLDSAPASASASVNSSAFNPQPKTLGPSTTPAISKFAGWNPAIAAGQTTLTIDLTALPGTQGALDGTGKKVKAIRLQNSTAANGVVTIGPGDANAYQLFGTGNSVTIPAKGMLYMEFDDSLAAVAAGAKNLKLTGTAENAYKLEIFLG